jgi:hypothetical protein
VQRGWSTAHHHINIVEEDSLFHHHRTHGFDSILN